MSLKSQSCVEKVEQQCPQLIPLLIVIGGLAIIGCFLYVMEYAGHYQHEQGVGLAYTSPRQIDFTMSLIRNRLTKNSLLCLYDRLSQCSVEYFVIANERERERALKALKYMKMRRSSTCRFVAESQTANEVNEQLYFHDDFEFPMQLTPLRGVLSSAVESFAMIVVLSLLYAIAINACMAYALKKAPESKLKDHLFHQVSGKNPDLSFLWKESQVIFPLQTNT